MPKEVFPEREAFTDKKGCFEKGMMSDWIKMVLGDIQVVCRNSCPYLFFTQLDAIDRCKMENWNQ